jgi:predicted transcriptional regulator
MTDQQNTNDLNLIADIVSAYVSNNPLPLAELPNLINSVAATVRSVRTGNSAEAEQPKQQPAVPIKKSITPDYIISLEDGKKFKSLKRALATRYGLTPDEYRQKWGLPRDYPMVAPNYAAARSELARKMGLGRKPKEAAQPEPARKRGRRKKVETAA